MRRTLALLGALFLMVAPAEPARADDESRTVVSVPKGPGRDVGISVSVLWGPPGTETGWGFARVEVKSDDTDAHDVRLSLGETGPDGSGALTSRRVHLEPHGRARVWLPRVNAQEDNVEIRVDDLPVERIWAGSGGTEHVCVLVTDDAAAAPDLRASKTFSDLAPPTDARGYVTRMRGTSSTSSSTGDAFLAVRPEDLPPTWTCLTSAPVVAVNAASRGMDDAARQRVLLDYAEAGGTLLVLSRDSLPKGPLADAIAGRGLALEAGLDRGAAGLGLWFSTSQGDLSGGADHELAKTWPVVYGASRAAHDAVALVPVSFQIPQRIPGVGRVNPRLFLFLILAFAVLVGPVAYVVLKKRRRLTLMLAVVPATGLLFTLAILGYGLLSEGLSTRGVVDSVTFLDQKEHVASTVAGRTLFAGWGPSSLRLSPDTVLCAPASAREQPWVRMMRSRPPPARFVLDADSGTVGGSLLPSRTVTVLSTLTREKARERLRFRQRGDGGYEVLTAEGFEPVAREGAILFHDFAGQWWRSDAAGTVLANIDETGARRALAALAGQVAHVDMPDDPEPEFDDFAFVRFSSGPSEEVTNRETWVGRALPNNWLPMGTYAAWTTRAPAFDDLGLSVDWKWASHLVIGRLAPEDVE